MLQDPDITAIAAILADSSRAAMLTALSDGRAMPAGELARIASVSAQTASSHLARMLDAALVKVEVQGRHRYYRIAGKEVGDMIEAIALVAPPRTSLTQFQSEAGKRLRFARTCYGHLAGVLGVSVAEAMVSKGYFEECDAGWLVTRAGERWLSHLTIDVNELRRKRRPMTRQCLDWSERRHHIAGALGDALAARCFEMRWIARTRQSRALLLTDRGRAALRAELGITL